MTTFVVAITAIGQAFAGSALLAAASKTYAEAQDDYERVQILGAVVYAIVVVLTGIVGSTATRSGQITLVIYSTMASISEAACTAIVWMMSAIIHRCRQGGRYNRSLNCEHGEEQRTRHIIILTFAVIAGVLTLIGLVTVSNLIKKKLTNVNNDKDVTMARVL